MTDPIYLFNDTETTGLPSSTKATRDPGQARIMQTAYILADKTGRHLAEVRLLLRPDGWKAGQGAIAVHGLTDEYCEQYGVSSRLAFETFLDLASRANTFVSHNNRFDWGLHEIEARAHGLKMPKFQNKICTMLDTGQSSGHRSLAKVYEHFTGKVISDDAHDAMVDCLACRDILYAWKAKSQKKEAVTVPVAAFDEAAYADLV